MQTHCVLCDLQIECLRTMWIYFSDFCIVFRKQQRTYEGWNFNSGNYLFTTDTK